MRVTAIHIYDSDFVSGPLGHRAVFQVDKTESEDQELFRYERECGEDSDMVRALRLFADSLPEVPFQGGLFAIKASREDSG